VYVANAVRQHGQLDVARDFQVTLERQAICHFHQDEEVHQDEPQQQPASAVDPLWRDDWNEEQKGCADAAKEYQGAKQSGHQRETVDDAPGW
jgi:hypothetical protein